MQVSRFGVISNGGRPGAWQLILDLSSPPYLNINKGIDPQMCSMQYLGATTRGTARKARCGPCLPVHLEDHHLLGMRWGHKILDLTLPLIGPRPFPDALEWVL